MTYDRQGTAGFSLIEMVIVVVILGVVAAIAIPRFSRGADGATASALAHDLAVMNKALDIYATEHGGQYPDPDYIESQLTKQTYDDGDTPHDPPLEMIYGPYLREIPPVPVGPMKGASGIDTRHADGVGWIYEVDSQRITINLGGLEAETVLSARELIVLNRFLNN
ncbi:MAG: prepilin-type N-terminal cleavage/methylation domain-containing protein [Planctomycetota bacterium]